MGLASLYGIALEPRGAPRAKHGFHHELRTVVLDNGVEIPAHRLVLASASAYFRTMFRINMHESSKERIHLRDVDSASMEALVDFAYTGKIS